jgi:hypothetical protein
MVALSAADLRNESAPAVGLFDIATKVIFENLVRLRDIKSEHLACQKEDWKSHRSLGLFLGHSNGGVDAGCLSEPVP